MPAQPNSDGSFLRCQLALQYSVSNAGHRAMRNVPHERDRILLDHSALSSRTRVGLRPLVAVDPGAGRVRRGINWTPTASEVQRLDRWVQRSGECAERISHCRDARHHPVEELRVIAVPVDSQHHGSVRVLRLHKGLIEGRESRCDGGCQTREHLVVDELAASHPQMWQAELSKLRTVDLAHP